MSPLIYNCFPFQLTEAKLFRLVCDCHQWTAHFTSNTKVIQYVCTPSMYIQYMHFDFCFEFISLLWWTVRLRRIYWSTVTRLTDSANVISVGLTDSMCDRLCLSCCLSICLSECPSVCLSDWLSVRLFVESATKTHFIHRNAVQMYRLLALR